MNHFSMGEHEQGEAEQEAEDEGRDAGEWHFQREHTQREHGPGHRLLRSTVRSEDVTGPMRIDSTIA